MTCQLKAPRLTLAYLGDVITVTAESIQFWRELGVGPVNGAKDVTYFLVAFEDGPGLKLVPSVAETYQVGSLMSLIDTNLVGAGLRLACSGQCYWARRRSYCQQVELA